MSIDILDCERVAYVAGLAAGLGQALVDTDPAAAPGRFAAVPVARVRPGMQVVPHSVAAAEGVSFVRVPGTGAGPARLGLLLAAARLGVTHRLLDDAIARLSTRDSGGEPLIRKQLVVGALADLLVGIEALRRQLCAAGDEPSDESTVDVHDAIDRLDWELAMLYGASGYLADQPARVLYVSALVANAWITRGACRAAA